MLFFNKALFALISFITLYIGIVSNLPAKRGVCPTLSFLCPGLLVKRGKLEFRSSVA